MCGDSLSVWFPCREAMESRSVCSFKDQFLVQVQSRWPSNTQTQLLLPVFAIWRKIAIRAVSPLTRLLVRLWDCRLRLRLDWGNTPRGVSWDFRDDWLWDYRLRNRNAWDFESWEEPMIRDIPFFNCKDLAINVILVGTFHTYSLWQRRPRGHLRQ